MNLRLLVYILVGLAYLVFPRDALPDFAGLVGRVDDLLVILYLVWRYRKSLQRQDTDSATEDFSEPESSEDRVSGQQAERQASYDPYQVLEVDKRASWEEITQSYRRLATQYHPDKVEHLGPELKELAHNKMVLIQKAYGDLKEKQGK